LESTKDAPKIDNVEDMFQDSKEQDAYRLEGEKRNSIALLIFLKDNSPTELL
jgi:hypothetical protein